jgi:hypothetical protein
MTSHGIACPERLLARNFTTYPGIKSKIFVDYIFRLPVVVILLCSRLFVCMYK